MSETIHVVKFPGVKYLHHTVEVGEMPNVWSASCLFIFGHHSSSLEKRDKTQSDYTHLFVGCM